MAPRSQVLFPYSSKRDPLRDAEAEETSLEHLVILTSKVIKTTMRPVTHIGVSLKGLPSAKSSNMSIQY